MPGHRLKRIYSAVSAQLVPGTGDADKQTVTACYGFSGGNGTSVFYEGTDDTGRILSICRGTASVTDRDQLDGNGGIIEAVGGVYVTCTTLSAGTSVLVDESCREA